ncbi:GGDEF domain-containing protein [Desulfurobacterium atlanticum]|uniref:diguanylate cyclase n=1 Tax=Desulfurobacterium atlanticum TaxID=240169 RepID=A0A238YH81_9BACT|nr:GGDEF domain-containing protein [Desulfurobacterium atlanticum]SNR70322.1 diguanylate cyclase (GGDEF) domain-containing protein [Desulfurobacterium atlanticum]
MVNIRRRLIISIAAMSIISGIAAPITIHHFFLEGYPVTLPEFVMSLTSNFLLGWFIYYVIVSGNLKEYFDTLTNIFKKIRHILEGSKSHSIEEIKDLKIEAEKGDFIYKVSKEINHFIEKLYYNELLDRYQREVGKLFVTLSTPQVLAESFYKFLLEKFGMVGMAVFVKENDGTVSNVACFNFNRCELSDFVKACFDFKDLKLLSTSGIDLKLVDNVKVKEILVIPFVNIDFAAVLILAKPDKFTGFELRFLRRIRDLMSLGLTNARNYSRLQEESYLDPLTKLYNRRFGMKRFQEILSLASREEKPVVVAMMDIDNFKRINDTYGHLAGDYVLRNLAAIVKSHIRDVDLVVRYGGEEILLVLFNTDEDAGYKVLERIRKNIEEFTFEFEGQEIPVTVSIGCYPILPDELKSGSFSIETFIEKADEALYKAKKTGKNKVVCYSDSY